MGTIGVAVITSNLTARAASVDALRLEVGRVSDHAQEVEQIYREYGAMVRRRCLSILRNEEEAEEVLQDVFVRVLRSIGTFRGQSSPATWLYRIATNICLNRIRNVKNRARLDKEVLQPPEPTEAVEAWPRDLAVRILSGFDRATRETVLYSVIEEMTHEEVAQVMNCSVSLVRKRIAKFRTRAPKRAAKLLKGGRT